MSSHKKCTPDNVDKVIEEIVEEYQNEILEGVPQTIDFTANRTKKLLRAYAIAKKIGGKKYVNSFTVVKGKSNAFMTTVNVASTQYQLTHLLERGHAKRNQYGEYEGTTNAYPHWAKAEEHAIKLLEEKIIEVINKG